MSGVGVTGEMIQNPIVLKRISTDPVTTLDTGFVYTKDVVGVTQLFYKDSAGLVTQITPPPVGGVTLNGAYNFGGPGAGRTITAISGAVDISSTVNNTLALTRTQAAEIVTVGNVGITTNYSAVGMADNRSLTSIVHTVNWTGNSLGTNKFYISGQLNKVNVGSTNGRWYSGDLAQATHDAIYSFKTEYTPGGTGRPVSLINAQIRYDHNGDSSATTGTIIGLDVENRFGAYSYTVTTMNAFRVTNRFAATLGAGVVTNCLGFQVNANIIPVGGNVTVTNNYGLKIETQTGGVNNWSFFVTGGLSYFGGDIQGNANINMTGGNGTYVRVPQMLPANRPAVPAAGMIIFNTTTSQFEGYSGAAWVVLG